MQDTFIKNKLKKPFFIFEFPKRILLPKIIDNHFLGVFLKTFFLRTVFENVPNKLLIFVNKYLDYDIKIKGG